MSKRWGRSRRSRGTHGDSQHTTGRSTLMMATVLLLLHADALPSPLAFDNPFHKSNEPADGAVTVGIVGFASLPIMDGYPAQMMKMADVPGAGRLFVNDMGGVLYSVSEAFPSSTRVTSSTARAPSCATRSGHTTTTGTPPATGGRRKPCWNT